MSDSKIPDDMKLQARLAAMGVKDALDGNALQGKDINVNAIGAGEGVSPVNTPNYEPGYTGVWNPAPEPTPAPTPEAAPEMSGPEPS